MNKQQINKDLDGAIDQLQAAIQQTRVPGELDDWLKPVSDALQHVKSLLLNDGMPRHRRDFTQISEDPALIPKVDQLKAEDQEILKTVEQATSLAERAASVLARSHGQEEEVNTLTQLSQLAHDIVIRLRSQEEAIDTWFLESVNRDEGVSG